MKTAKQAFRLFIKWPFLTMTCLVHIHRNLLWPSKGLFQVNELFKGFIHFYFEVNIKYLFFFEPWLKFRICKVLSNFWKLCVIYLIWHFWLLTTLTTLMDFSSLKIKAIAPNLNIELRQTGRGQHSEINPVRNGLYKNRFLTFSEVWLIIVFYNLDLICNT